MKHTGIYIAAALAAFALAGCRAEQAQAPETVSEARSYTLRIQAEKVSDTRALSLDENVLNAYWKDTETVKVYKGGVCIGELSVEPLEGEKPTTAALTGEINVEGLETGNELTLLLPRDSWDYSGQKGILSGAGSIEDTYDYTMATVTVTRIEGSAVTTSGAEFQHQQSIYRFGFKAGDAALPVGKLYINATSWMLIKERVLDGSAWVSTPGTIIVKPEAPTSDLLYISLRNEIAGTGSTDAYEFTIIGDDNAAYLGTKAIPASALNAQGRFISSASVDVTKAVMAVAADGTEEVW